jgi:hypothetical protein
MTTTSGITLEKVESRVYFSGNTYPVKDQIKRLGGHWDGDRKQWWVGAAKADEAANLVAGIKDAPAAKTGPADKTRVHAKVEYKGRTYYVIGESADRCRLTVLDGTIDFWADKSACKMLKEYTPREQWDGRHYSGRTEMVYTTLGSLRRFVARLKRQEASGVHSACGRNDCRRLSGEWCSDCHDEE